MKPEKIQLKIETLHYHFRAVYALSSYVELNILTFQFNILFSLLASPYY